MLPGSVDPRRPEKQQRYKPPPASNNAAPGEDLTPDYMNILDPQRKSMRSDRFKVVKIESTEPFKRGRWECMDFLDQSYSRVFQRNSNNERICHNSRQVSSDTNIRPVSPVINNSDLQSSMLHIFYRQNNSIFDKNVTVFSDKQVQNHVLRPGMVSSSLIGIKYPFELNFEKGEQLPSNEYLCKPRAATVYDCHVYCDNQKFRNMSSDYTNFPVYPNLNQDHLNNGQYIENTVTTQQNYSQIYQEQIITYVDNSIPQQIITTSTTEVYTTTLTPTYTTDYNSNKSTIDLDDFNDNLTQITTPTSPHSDIDSPTVVYGNSNFQEEDQYQSNVIYENDKIGSATSSHSFENFVTSDKFETELKPGLEEVFNPTLEPLSISEPTVVPNQTESLLMPEYQEPPAPIQIDVSSVRSFLRDERNLIACTNQIRGSQSIDGKIEQLMDLVKKHLKYAVLEDVNDMKQQILILKGRIAQLEYENALLRSCEERYRENQDSN